MQFCFLPMSAPNQKKRRGSKRDKEKEADKKAPSPVTKKRANKDVEGPLLTVSSADSSVVTLQWCRGRRMLRVNGEDGSPFCDYVDFPTEPQEVLWSLAERGTNNFPAVYHKVIQRHDNANQCHVGMAYMLEGLLCLAFFHEPMLEVCNSFYIRARDRDYYTLMGPNLHDGTYMTLCDNWNEDGVFQAFHFVRDLFLEQYPKWETRLHRFCSSEFRERVFHVLLCLKRRFPRLIKDVRYLIIQALASVDDHALRGEYRVGCCRWFDRKYLMNDCSSD